MKSRFWNTVQYLAFKRKRLYIYLGLYDYDRYDYSQPVQPKR